MRVDIEVAALALNLSAGGEPQVNRAREQHEL
jgi:hypothetical protein